MTVRICSHRRSLLPMQSDVLNETQQISNDNDCSSSLSSNSATTLLYSGFKLHPKPLVPTISMPGVASPLSIVKKLSLPDAHLENGTNSIRNSSSTVTNSSNTSTPSSIRLVTPTGKSSPPTNGGFSASKTFIFNPQQSSTTTTTTTTTVNKQSILPNSNTSSSLLTLIPPGTTSPKIQTLNSVTIASNSELAVANELQTKTSTLSNQNQSLFLAKNRLTLVQPLITNPNSTSTNTVTSKLVLQQSSTSTGTNPTFWPTQPTTQATKIFSIPPSSILPTAKMLSRPVQLIPTSLSSTEHHPQITHVQTIKTEKHETINSYPLSMHFGLSSPTTNENPLNVSHGHPFGSAHQAYIHMQLLPSTSTNESTNGSQPVQLTLPTTHLYSSPSSVLISTTQRSMDHNNNHQSNTTITTPIIREMQIEEKLNESSTIKNIHSTKNSTKNRTRLPLQPSAQQLSTSLPSSSSSASAISIRQPKKHKLIEDEQTSSNEPPLKIPHYEQLDSKSRPRPLSKFSTENTTPLNSSSNAVETSGIGRKRSSTETSHGTFFSRKRRTMNKINHGVISNENFDQQISTSNSINGSTETSIDQIDDELLKRLSHDFLHVDQRTGIRWIGTKTRPKSMNTLVSRFSWKPKINHYEKYSDIIRTNPKRSVPVKSLESIRKRFDEPWASWRIDRLTSYFTDLTHDEQMTQNQLSDILQSFKLNDSSVQKSIEDLIESNIQRHRCFCEQLNQISTLLHHLLDHGNKLKEICSISKTNPPSKRTKER